MPSHASAPSYFAFGSFYKNQTFFRYGSAIVVAALTYLVTAGCERNKAPTVAAVTKNYADLVYRSYSDALNDAYRLRAAIDRFTEAPSASRLEMAKRAWLDARWTYGQTEAYRFYDGPIDNENTGPEGRINGWPLDEAYIDYVSGDRAAGLVNRTDLALTREALANFNEGAQGDILSRGDAFDPEKAVATGYHAIEFLLWGQDESAHGPGQRPWQDYLVGSDATSPNAERRQKYLKIVTDVLVEDLESLQFAWAPKGVDNYRTEFLRLPENTALRSMLTGIGVLAKGELAGERIDVALDTLDQEDEHSCFSDNTHRDILANANGIRNVYLGQYKRMNGPSLSDLVRSADAKLDRRVRALLDDILDSIDKLAPPFDQALAERESEGWKQADSIVKKLYDLGDQLVKVSSVLKIGTLSVSLPE